MAKILLNVYWNGEGSPHSKFINAFFEGFIENLIEAGNDVYLILSNDFTNYRAGNLELKKNISRSLFAKTLGSLEPDLFISFNHSFCDELTKLLKCPMAIWFVDPPNCQPELDKCKKNSARYHSFFPNPIERERSISELGFDSKKSFVIPDATAIRAKPTEQKRNIVFLGSRFEIEWKLREFFKECLNTQYFSEFARKLWTEFKKSPEKNIFEVCESIGWVDFYRNHAERCEDFSVALKELVAAEKRQNVLRAVADLGLHLIGPSRWLDLLRFSADLGTAFEELTVFSLSETEQLYNSALIGVNINHAYTKLGFSWRARDVMASNAVLLTNQNLANDLQFVFGPKVKVPVFSSPIEAREISQKLIREPEWRKEIVASSHEIIDADHRFSHRIKLIESEMNIRLSNTKMRGGLYEIKPDEANPILVLRAPAPVAKKNHSPSDEVSLQKF